MNLKHLTLIVPTKNEAQNIGAFLDSVPEEIQIIVVDDSTDHTCEIIRKKRRKAVQIIRDPGNIAAARQLAADHARTKWLLFSDADVMFAKNYFKTLRYISLREHQGGLVGAKLSRGRYRFYYRCFSKWLWLCCTLGLPGASGSNMLVCRRALMEVGGFDRRLSCNEDTELIWRLQKQGYEVDYSGKLKVFEFDHRRLDGGVLKKVTHSLVRCLLLLCGLKSVLRKDDWGYWRSKSARQYLA